MELAKEVEDHIKEVMDKLWALYDMYAKNYFSSSGTAGNTLALLNLHSFNFN
jgi:threonine aldolase